MPTAIANEEALEVGGRLVLVETAGGRFGVPADDVIEYVPCGSVVRIPSLQKQVKGLGRYRDRALPVIDVDALGGEASAADDQAGGWLVVRWEGGLLILGIRGMLGLGSVDTAATERVSDRHAAVQTRVLVEQNAYWVVESDRLL